MPEPEKPRDWRRVAGDYRRPEAKQVEYVVRYRQIAFAALAAVGPERAPCDWGDRTPGECDV